MNLKFFVNALILIAVFSLFLNNLAFAQTPTPTESLILQLQQQIKALQEQVTKLQVEVSSTKTELEIVKTELQFTKALSRGTTGDEVKQLQEFLKQFPDIYPQGLVTGYFGPLTEAAVRKFQEKQGIESIGVVGPKTLSKLNELITEGAGASDVIPPGLLIAPGIQKKLEAPTTTAPVVTAPVTPSPQPAAATPTGICLIKDRYIDIPRFDIADFGNGFAKYAVNGVNAVSGLKTSCTKTIYDYLLQNYCKTNSNPIQRLVMTYGANGIGDAGSLSCNALGCDFINCSSVASLAPISIPTTATTTTITPTTTTTTAQTTTATTTVPTTTTTTNAPTTTTTTTTTTTATTTVSTADTAPPSVTLTGPSAGLGGNCTVQVGYSVSDNSGTVILQQKVDGVNYGSEISNTTVPNGSITGGGCQNLANGSHTYTVVARDPAGNTTTKDLNFSLPLSTADTAPPVISGLGVAQITLTTNSASVSWSTNEPADSLVEYGLTNSYGSSKYDSALITTPHDVNIAGLTSSTMYHYRVKSKDAAGNIATSGDSTFWTFDVVTSGTSTSSLDPRSRNAAIISQMVNSLNEILKQLSQLLK